MGNTTATAQKHSFAIRIQGLSDSLTRRCSDSIVNMSTTSYQRRSRRSRMLIVRDTDTSHRCKTKINVSRLEQKVITDDR